jgi:hypothetical protein
LLLKADNPFIFKKLNKLMVQLVITLSLAIKTVEKPDQEAGLTAS